METEPVEPLLEARSIRRSFGGLVAVNVESVTFPRNRITSLIGPNGAGKTTLFNLLTGFERADEGSWRLDGRDITGLPAHRIAQIGMVRTFQLTRPIARLTVLESVMLATHGHPGERLHQALLRPTWSRREREVEERAMEVLEHVGLASKVADRAGDLSGGQRRLLEIARGLVSDPVLLMLDEPMAGVNPALVDSLLGTIEQIRDAGTTVVLIEHDMDAVTRVSDHVICLSQGEVISEGTAAEVMSDPGVVEAYLGKEWGSSTATVRGNPPDSTEGSATPAIELRSVVAGYVSGVDILRGCSLEVAPAEIVGVIGPNGAGKSTLLKALMGLVRISSGEAFIAGEQVTDLPIHARVSRRLAFVPQMDNVFQHLSIRENLQVGAYQQRDRFEETFEWLAGMFPMVSERAHQRASTLSGGQRQILALARALMIRPMALVVDEPSAGLSPIHQGDVFEQLQAIRSAGVAVLVVEQNARACLQIADRGYVLEQGRDVRHGPAGELLTDPRVVELYLGTRGTAGGASVP